MSAVASIWFGLPLWVPVVLLNVIACGLVICIMYIFWWWLGVDYLSEHRLADLSKALTLITLCIIGLSGLLYISGLKSQRYIYQAGKDSLTQEADGYYLNGKTSDKELTLKISEKEYKSLNTGDCITICGENDSLGYRNKTYAKTIGIELAIGLLLFGLHKVLMIRYHQKNIGIEVT